MENRIEIAIVKSGISTSILALKEKYTELQRYVSIMNQVHLVNVSGDKGFQKEFNYFYKVRRNESWREKFYGLFEKCKGIQDLTFEYVIRTLYAESGNIEASFSSKLLATINANMPIWDSIVLRRLDLTPCQSANKEERLADAVEIYQEIIRCYRDFLTSPQGKMCINSFDKAFPEFASFSAVKKIDFLLWGGGM